jgi:hypothetical protein
MNHMPNFIGAHIFCTNCITSEIWKEKLSPQSPCEICGPHRFLSWAPFSITANAAENLHHTNTENPVRLFLEWVLRETNSKFHSQVFAHNAGRFGRVVG